jgi:hypothetical protein
LKKGQDENAQKAINREIAEFVSRQLKGKNVWIDVTKPEVYAGPNQYLGVVWLSEKRDVSLQHIMVKKGLGTATDDRFKVPLPERDQ